MQEFVSEFICFVTSEANDTSLAANRKAISQEDILNALENLDLAAFVPPMEAARKVKDFNSKEDGSFLKRHRNDASEQDEQCVLREDLHLAELENSFTSTRSADSVTDSSTREPSPVSSREGSFKSQKSLGVTLEIDYDSCEGSFKSQKSLGVTPKMDGSCLGIDYSKFAISSPVVRFAASNATAESAAQHSLRQAAVVLASAIIPEHTLPSNTAPVFAQPWPQRPQWGHSMFQALPFPAELPHARATMAPMQSGAPSR